MKSMALSLLVLFGCGLDKNPEARPDYSGLKAEVTANQERWAALSLQDYSYRLSKNCFCDLKDFRIEVRETDITDVRSQPDTAKSREVPLDSDRDIQSIDQVFATVLAWADEHPDSLSVTFDPEYFFVSRAFIDQRDGVADDSTELTVAEFAPIADR